MFITIYCHPARIICLIPIHRWTTVVIVLEDMVKHDSPIKRSCAHECGVAKSSDVDAIQMVKFYSVLFPMSLA